MIICTTTSSCYKAFDGDHPIYIIYGKLVMLHHLLGFARPPIWRFRFDAAQCTLNSFEFQSGLPSKWLSKPIVAKLQCSIWNWCILNGLATGSRDSNLSHSPTFYHLSHSLAVCTSSDLNQQSGRRFAATSQLTQKCIFLFPGFESVAKSLNGIWCKQTYSAIDSNWPWVLAATAQVQ